MQMQLLQNVCRGSNALLCGAEEGSNAPEGGGGGGCREGGVIALGID